MPGLQVERVESGSGMALAAHVVTSKGVAQLRMGEFAQARRTLATAAEVAELSGSEPLIGAAWAHHALAAALNGNTQLAIGSASRAAALAPALTGFGVPGAAPIALAWAQVEIGDSVSATRALATAVAIRHVDALSRGLTKVVEARLLRGRGDPTAALVLIDETHARTPTLVGWLSDLLDVEAAEAEIRRGEPDRAVCLLSALDDSSAPAAALTRARAHFARSDTAGARRALRELASAPEALPSIVVGGQLLQAALELRVDDRCHARATVATAERLAASEALRRPFLEAPPDVRQLLGDGATHSNRNSLTGEELVQPLTAKEREVLGHLSELLTTEEIAKAMFVSVNTVRTHVRSILRKLSVSRRNEAVRRARALSLIG